MLHQMETTDVGKLRRAGDVPLHGDLATVDARIVILQQVNTTKVGKLRPVLLPILQQKGQRLLEWFQLWEYAQNDPNRGRQECLGQLGGVVQRERDIIIGIDDVVEVESPFFSQRCGCSGVLDNHGRRRAECHGRQPPLLIRIPYVSY